MRETGDDLITMVVPATTSYVRIARIGAATIALRRGFSFREIHDLRLAIDEALIMLLGDHEREGTITVDFVVSDDRVDIDARAGFDDDATLRSAAVERFDALAAGLVDDYDIDPEKARVHLSKRRG